MPLFSGYAAHPHKTTPYHIAQRLNSTYLLWIRCAVATVNMSMMLIAACFIVDNDLADII